MNLRSKAIFDKVRKRYAVPQGTRARLERLVAATEELAFIGAQRPEDFEAIEHEFELALDRFFYFLYREKI